MDPATNGGGCSLTLRITLREGAQPPFSEWQGRFNEQIAAATGFISLEILVDGDATPTPQWLLVQRFDSAANADAWRASTPYRVLLSELQPLLAPGCATALLQSVVTAPLQQSSVTEVILTQVQPGQESAFRRWMARIHHIEAQFPGFKGVYVQAPRQSGSPWITLLQFDTADNLDRWLSSRQRRQIIAESHALISAIDSHRVVSPFAGWFATQAGAGPVPPAWKQTMIVLLVLYPIVMLEIIFLMPLLRPLDTALSTFIGNALSVTLVSWPLAPVAIRLLRWWLAPPTPASRAVDLYGALLLCGLYLLAVALFWLWT